MGELEGEIPLEGPFVAEQAEQVREHAREEATSPCRQIGVHVTNLGEPAAVAVVAGRAGPAGILVTVTADANEASAPSLYERAGGGEVFETIVARFYEGVAADPVLRPLYPEQDLAAAEERLAAFIVQVAGGPQRYTATRGHPRLRFRHMAFPISPVEGGAWLAAMERALAGVSLPPDVRADLWAYFERTAAFLVNTGGLTLGRRQDDPAGTDDPAG